MAKARDDMLKEFLRSEIIRAAENGDTAKIDTCLEKGADIDTVDNDKRSLLFMAVARNADSTVAHLLSQGANIDLGDFDSGETPLMRAVAIESMHILKTLLDKGADVFALNGKGRSVIDLLEDKSFNDNTKRQQARDMILNILPAAAVPAAQAEPIDPRVKEDTQSAPMPDLKKKPFPGAAPATGGP